MRKLICAFIEKNHLLEAGEHCLVALSGGADSVALLRFLLSEGYNVEAAHCNFHLRGDESNRDEAFVTKLCVELNVPLHLAHFDTRSYASLHGQSIEMAARELRYHYFEQLCSDLNIKTLCVAHHADDNIETFFINLMRGTGINGLAAIKPKRPISPNSQIKVVRPLLCVDRKTIEQWLEGLGQFFVTDSTNTIDDIIRNKLRLNILPTIYKTSPSAKENILTTIEQLNEAKLVYDCKISEFIREKIIDNTLNINVLSIQPSPLSVLFEWLTPYGFSSSAIRQLHEHFSTRSSNTSGRFWQSSTHEIYINREQLLLCERHEEQIEMKIPETGTYIINEQTKIKVRMVDETKVSKVPFIATLDASQVSFPLTLRTSHPGDRFTPFGMRGSKLVSDYLTDLKISLPEKRRQLVVADAQGAIVWLVGRRTSDICRITSETKKTLTLELVSPTTVNPLF